LRYIVGLPEGDEIMEEVDSKLFGNILHKAVEELYKLSGNEITIAWIDNVLKDKIILEQIIRKAFATEYFKTDEAKAKQLVFEGNVRLTYEYIKAYVVQLLKVDGKITPFEIVSLEDKYTWEVEVLINGSIKNIPVGGIIDRLDRVGGKIRIIDYKTGLVNSMSVNSMDSLFNQNIKTQKKEAFQAFLYSLIIKKQYFPDDVIEPGIYALRNIFNDSFNPRFIYARKELVFNNVVDEFEDQLKQLLQEIFSVDNVFHQTEILEHCKYCPYNIMCHRN
jgi:ATP-dependent exoDNAse (exonuclease V) beta subunit